MQWFTRVSHYTDVPITFASGAVVVSNKAFNKIAAEHRDTVLKICRTRFRELVEKTRVQNAESLVEIGKNGVQRVEVQQAEIDRFRAIGEKVWEEQVDKLYPRALLDQVVGATDSVQ